MFSSQAMKKKIFSLKCMILAQQVYIVVTNNLHGYYFVKPDRQTKIFAVHL